MPKALRRPILVTGSHRSGSTWKGRMLSLSKEARYIPEIFNPVDGLLASQKLFPVWFTYVTNENAADYKSAISSCLHRVASRPDYVDGLSWLSPRTYSRYLRFYIKELFIAPRLVIKDPIAALASEWLAKEFDMDVVVVVRHPAAFVRSMLRVKWSMDLSKQFASQPLLVRDILDCYREKLSNPPQDHIVNLATVWLMIYHVLHIYVGRNPGWTLVRHEDLSLQPVQAFRDLFSRLSLAYDEKIEVRIIEYTKASNPADAPNNVAEHLKRDSAANVKRWKSVLSDDQVLKIRNTVEPLCHLYYDDEDW